MFSSIDAFQVTSDQLETRAKQQLEFEVHGRQIVEAADISMCQFS